MKFKLKKVVDDGSIIPKGFGVAIRTFTPDKDRGDLICYPIIINVVVGFFHKLYQKMRFKCASNENIKMFSEGKEAGERCGFEAGYLQGYSKGYYSGERGGYEIVTESQLKKATVDYFGYDKN